MRRIFFCTTVLAVGLFGCRHDSPLQKIMDGAPAGQTITALPVNATQGFHLLERDMVSLIVAVTHRTALIKPSYSDITNMGGGIYRFVAADVHYGQVTVDFSFRDGSNSTIDPIQSPSSTATIKSVDINASSAGLPFNGSGHLTITLDRMGDVESAMRLTGSYTMTEQPTPNYTVIFTLPAPGALATFTGISAGTVQLSGSGPGGAVGGAVLANVNREYNGTVIWDGQTGEVHIQQNGNTLLLLNNLRYFFS